MLKTILFLLILVLSIFEAVLSEADVVYLKNGRKMEGLIKEETGEYILLELGFGTTKLEKNKIKEIQRSSRKEAESMQKNWGIESQQRKERWQELSEEEKSRQAKARLQREIRKKKEEAAEIPREKIVEYIEKQNSIGVTATINNKVTANLMVDTGASAILLTPQIAQRLGLSCDSSRVAITLADGRIAEARPVYLDSVMVNGMEVRNVPAVVLLNKNSFVYWDGLLGMSFLKHFIFQIDTKERKLVLKKKTE